MDSPGFSMGRPSTASSASASRPGTAGASSSRRPGTGVGGSSSSSRKKRPVTSSGYGQVRRRTTPAAPPAASSRAGAPPKHPPSPPHARCQDRDIPLLGLGVTGAALHSGGTPAHQQPQYQDTYGDGDGDGWTTASTAAPQQQQQQQQRKPRNRATTSSGGQGRPPASAGGPRPGTGSNRRKTKTGKLPAYLVARNREVAAENAAQVRYAEDMRDCPPGHVVMEEGERRQHVAVLRQAKAHLEDAFSQLSVTSSTVRHRRQQADLESEMAETEAELRFFSKPKVYILP